MNADGVDHPGVCVDSGRCAAGFLALALELLAVFILGLALVTFLYAGPGGVPEGDRGLPG